VRLDIRNPKDFWAGAIFVAVGAAALWFGAGYERGTAGAMGPGYFPRALGILLAAIGAACMIRAARGPKSGLGAWPLRKAALVLLSVAAFAVLVRGAGLVPAIVVLVLLSGRAHERFRPGPFLLLGAATALFAALVFVRALGLPMQPLGPWIGF
jgi:putative tricarboxylic transport membrane protein